jgi:hypothetical protein
VRSATALAVLLSACAPAYSLATRKPAPVSLHALDMVAFSAGLIVGINEYNQQPDQRNNALMWSGFAPALLVWSSYWLVRTSP